MLNGRGAFKPLTRPGTVGELTAINNIGRTRRWARSKTTPLTGESVPTIFVQDSDLQHYNH